MEIDLTYDSEVDYYYFFIDDKNDSTSIAQTLGLKYNDYTKILKKYGAVLYEKEYYFLSKEEIEKCLNGNELLPYITMMKIIN